MDQDLKAPNLAAKTNHEVVAYLSSALEASQKRVAELEAIETYVASMQQQVAKLERELQIEKESHELSRESDENWEKMYISAQKRVAELEARGAALTQELKIRSKQIGVACLKRSRRRRDRDG